MSSDHDHHDSPDHGDLDAILNDPAALLSEDGVLTPALAASGDPGALVLVTNFELLRVLEGHEQTFAAEGGAPIRIRLYSTDELLAAQKAAWDDQPDGDAHAAATSRQKAIELCRPIDVEAIARMRGSS